MVKPAVSTLTEEQAAAELAELLDAMPDPEDVRALTRWHQANDARLDALALHIRSLQQPAPAPPAPPPPPAALPKKVRKALASYRSRVLAAKSRPDDPFLRVNAAAGLSHLRRVAAACGVTLPDAVLGMAHSAERNQTPTS